MVNLPSFIFLILLSFFPSGQLDQAWGTLTVTPYISAGPIFGSNGVGWFSAFSTFKLLPRLNYQVDFAQIFRVAFSRFEVSYVNQFLPCPFVKAFNALQMESTFVNLTENFEFLVKISVPKRFTYCPQTPLINGYPFQVVSCIFEHLFYDFQDISKVFSLHLKGRCFPPAGLLPTPPFSKVHLFSPFSVLQSFYQAIS